MICHSRESLSPQALLDSGFRGNDEKLNHLNWNATRHSGFSTRAGGIDWGNPISPGLVVLDGEGGG